MLSTLQLLDWSVWDVDFELAVDHSLPPCSSPRVIDRLSLSLLSLSRVSGRIGDRIISKS